MAIRSSRTLAGTTHYEIPPTNKQAETRRLNNRNYMFTLNDTYPGAFAGKVGWTEESGHTLVTLAERGGVTLICIVLHSDGVIDAQYIDSTNLFDYGLWRLLADRRAHLEDRAAGGPLYGRGRRDAHRVPRGGGGGFHPAPRRDDGRTTLGCAIPFPIR